MKKFYKSKRFFITVISLFAVIALGSFIYAYSVLMKSKISDDSGGLVLGNVNNQTESLAIEDIDTVYYMKGDSTKLYPATNSTENVRFHDPKKEYGFDDIDIVVEGSVGDRYTLVFASGALDSDNMAFAGNSTSYRDIQFIQVDSVRMANLSIYGELYATSSLGVTVKATKQGIKLVLKSITTSKAAGVIVEFDKIAREEIYRIVAITLLGNGLEKTYKILCVNRNIGAMSNN